MSVHLRWLGQTTSEKGIPSVLLRRVLRKPRQLCAQFKLSAGCPRRNKQDQVEMGAIVGLAGAYRARKSPKYGPCSVVFGRFSAR